MIPSGPGGWRLALGGFNGTTYRIYEWEELQGGSWSSAQSGNEEAGARAKAGVRGTVEAAERANAANERWTATQDTQLVRLMDAVGQPAHQLSTYQHASTTLVRTSPLYTGLRGIAAEALLARCKVLLKLNQVVFECLLRWTDLGERSLLGTLANELCEVKALLLPEKKRAVFERLMYMHACAYIC